MPLNPGTGGSGISLHALEGTVRTPLNLHLTLLVGLLRLRGNFASRSCHSAQDDKTYKVKLPPAATSLSLSYPHAAPRPRLTSPATQPGPSPDPPKPLRSQPPTPAHERSLPHARSPKSPRAHRECWTGENTSNKDRKRAGGETVSPAAPSLSLRSGERQGGHFDPLLAQHSSPAGPY